MYPTHIVYVFVFAFLGLVYSMLPVSLDFPFLTAPSVFSTVYSVRYRQVFRLYILN